MPMCLGSTSTPAAAETRCRTIHRWPLLQRPEFLSVILDPPLAKTPVQDGRHPLPVLTEAPCQFLQGLLSVLIGTTCLNCNPPSAFATCLAVHPSPASSYCD